MIGEIELAELHAYMVKVLAEAKEEALTDDVVHRNSGYRSFTSRSKGIRNGKQRIRRRRKEIELIRYQTGWHYPHRAKLDEVASEVTHEQMGDDELLWHIREYCDHDGGSQQPCGLS